MSFRSAALCLSALLMFGSVACSARGGGGGPPVDTDSGTEDTGVNPPMDDGVPPPPDNGFPPPPDNGFPPPPDNGFPPPDNGPGCQLPARLCNGVCTNVQGDPSNCGACNRACPSGQFCAGGTCMSTCPAPRTMCGANCVDTGVDPTNCGSCGRACEGASRCVGGSCVPSCAPPMMTCGGSCVDVTSSNSHCGACNRACTSGQTCTGGVCMTTASGGVDPGRACTRNADCPSMGGCAHAVQGWSGGYCLYGCTAPGDCGPNGICITVGMQNVCFRSCSADSQCRTGYFCRRVPTGEGFCFPRCESTPDFCGAYQCNATTHACAAPCSTSSQCSSGSTCTSMQCRCGATTSCGANRRCYTTTGACGCANDSACGPDERCDTAAGTCVLRM